MINKIESIAKTSKEISNPNPNLLISKLDKIPGRHSNPQINKSESKIPILETGNVF